MPDWYSWRDLLHRWNKKDFELLEDLRQGLQPYSKYGEPVYCPQSCLPGKMAEKLSSVDIGSTTNFGWYFFTMPSSDEEMGKLISLLETTRFKRAFEGHPIVPWSSIKLINLKNNEFRHLKKYTS